MDYFITGVCYRSQDVDDCELSQLYNGIKLACDTDHPTLIMGDFNYPEMNWDTLRSDNKGSKFVKLVPDCYLEQHVKHSTRMDNILDLVLTRDLVIKDDIQILAPLDNCNHKVLMWAVDCETRMLSGY